MGVPQMVSITTRALMESCMGAMPAQQLHECHPVLGCTFGTTLLGRPRGPWEVAPVVPNSWSTIDSLTEPGLHVGVACPHCRKPGAEGEQLT